MTKESVIERYLVEQIEAIGGLAIKQQGTRGVPDRLVIYKGDMFFVEVKSANGRLEEHQRRYIRKLKARDVTVYVVSSTYYVDHIIDELKRVDAAMLAMIPCEGSA